ncbi:MAG: NAD(P)H-binding protein [Bacteroidales bacterium]
MENRTALVFGATGLVGRYLVEELIVNMRYTSVKVFTRRPLELEHIKVIEKVVDVENVDSYRDEIRGDDLFICLGTTIKKAGSVSRVEELDRVMPFKIASTAYENGVKRIAVVSAIGARSSASNFYNRIKGLMEEDITGLGFSRKVIVRPSMLLGRRSEFRLMETLGKGVMKGLSFIFTGKLKIYRAVHGRVVARAMIALLGIDEGRIIYLSDELEGLAGKAI